MEVTINIKGLEVIAGAINNMAEAVKGGKVQTISTSAPSQVIHQAIEQATPANQNVAAQQQISAPTQEQVSTQQPISQQQVNTYLQTQQPVQAPPVTNQQPVQTSAINYTLDNLSAAAMTLLDAGRQQDLLNLLAQFGVESLPALPQEQYGGFATALRGLGAQI